jgi:hypothetical protein
MKNKRRLNLIGLDERPCRKCGHEHWRKIDYKTITIEDLEEMIESRIPFAHCKDWDEGCRCRKWVSSDNLEYLEYKSKEQEDRDK